MFAVINNSQFFTAAHQLAKATRANFASYREAFAAALREGHKAVKKMQQIVADKIRRAVRLPAIKMVRHIGTVADKLIALGCKVWQGKRIYANSHAAQIFPMYDCCGRGRKAQMERAYFDIINNRWESNGFYVADEFAA